MTCANPSFLFSFPSFLTSVIHLHKQICPKLTLSLQINENVNQGVNHKVCVMGILAIINESIGALSVNLNWSRRPKKT